MTARAELRIPLFLAFAALCIASAYAQQKPAANRDIYLYQGPDRAERLVSEAKREGTVVLYSTMTLDDANPLLSAFEKKYGIKVSMWRAVNQNGGQPPGAVGRR